MIYESFKATSKLQWEYLERQVMTGKVMTVKIFRETGNDFLNFGNISESK